MNLEDIQEMNETKNSIILVSLTSLAELIDQNQESLGEIVEVIANFLPDEAAEQISAVINEHNERVNKLLTHYEDIHREIDKVNKEL